MSLSTAQLAARDGRLTASRVACLMTGNEAAILNLWREMVGDTEFVADDLSGVWPVQLGVATEALNLDWYERKTRRSVTRRGEVVTRRGTEWAAATLDGWDDTLPGPIEAKHVGGREPLATVIDRYQPQLHWQMIVTGAGQALLSVIEGANEPIVETIPLDKEYAAELWRRAEAFMRCVWTLTPPVAAAPVAAPIRPTREVDMTGSNSWASHAADWLAHRAAAKTFDAAAKGLKELVPSDAVRCFGHGIQAGRDRAGRLTIKEQAA